MTPLRAPAVVDQYFLEARCRLLDLAAFLDRADRGDGANAVHEDPRMKKIQDALALLADDHPERAARIQTLFSLPYDPAWPVPQPRTA